MDHFIGETITAVEGGADRLPLTPDALRRFRTAALRIVERRAAFVLAGEPSAPVGLLASGWMASERRLPAGRRVIVDLYLPGDLIGIDHLFLEHAPVDLVALTEAGYYALDGARLREHLRQDADLALLLMRRLAAGRAEHHRHLIRMAQLPSRDRVASLLVRLCERLTAQGPCRVPLTRQDLADHLGLSIIHANRALAELQNAGLIEMQSDGMLVRDADRLRAAAAARHEAA